MWASANVGRRSLLELLSRTGRQRRGSTLTITCRGTCRFCLMRRASPLIRLSAATSRRRPSRSGVISASASVDPCGSPACFVHSSAAVDNRAARQPVFAPKRLEIQHVLDQRNDDRPGRSNGVHFDDASVEQSGHQRRPAAPSRRPSAVLDARTPLRNCRETTYVSAVLASQRKPAKPWKKASIYT
jgi:hypothetical protein